LVWFLAIRQACRPFPKPSAQRGQNISRRSKNFFLAQKRLLFTLGDTEPETSLWNHHRLPAASLN